MNSVPTWTWIELAIRFLIVLSVLYAAHLWYRTKKIEEEIMESQEKINQLVAEISDLQNRLASARNAPLFPVGCDLDDQEEP